MPPATMLVPEQTLSADPARPVFGHPDRPVAGQAPIFGCRGTLDTDLTLRHGGTYAARLRWESIGDPALPAIAVLGGISADRHVAASSAFGMPGWWNAQVGPDLAIDPRAYRVIAIDWLAADGALDAPVDTADQAAALATVLDHLGVARLAAFVGCSYGAQVGFAFAAHHPRRLGHLIAISGGPRPHPYAAAYRSLQRALVAFGESAGRGEEALALARQLGMLSYRAPAEFEARFAAPAAIAGDRVSVAAESYLTSRGREYAARWAPAAFRRLSESIDLHQVNPAAIGVPCTLAAVEGDWLVPPSDVEDLAAALFVPADCHRITSAYGHDAFLKETTQIAAVLRAGLAAAAGETR